MVLRVCLALVLGILAMACGGGGGSSPAPGPTAIAPTITTQPQSLIVDVGQTATFTVVAAGTPAPTYQWRRNGTNLAGATSATTTTPATTLADSGTVFTVAVTNSAGTVVSEEALLTVRSGAQAPEITTQPQSLTVTVGQTAAFTVVATGTPAPTYQWRRNGADLAGATSATYSTPATTLADSGTVFTVAVSNSEGTVVSEAAVLTVLPPASGGAIVIDHTCTNLAAVPAAWILAAKANLRIGYTHTSHGSQLVTGLDALAAHLGGNYAFNRSNWGAVAGIFLNDSWASDHAADLGADGDLAWREATRLMLDAPGNDRNVVLWSWCGGVSSNTVGGIDAYLNAMAALELQYPNVRFVYMTGHLDGSGAAGNLNRRNEQIRAYCRANGKVLYDFADIESYDPDGAINFMALMATDGCDYTGGNWASQWVAAHPGHELAQMAAGCSECAHSARLNCVMKGRAFWWLLARLAGWNGS